MREINWAVLGCGVIANEMAVALQKQGRHIYAVGNRTREKANAIASHTDKQEGMYLAYTKDVMELMTACRREWNFTYPEEECNE